MVQRKTTLERKLALTQELRRSSQDGTLIPGDMLPTVRELSERHQLSVRIVAQELQKLVDEGVLYTIPRKGTFVGRTSVAEQDLYLLLTTTPDMPNSSAPHINYIRVGFEERVAQLGATSLVLPIDVALELKRQGMLPSCSGVFDFSYSPQALPKWPRQEGVPYLRLSGSSSSSTQASGLEEAGLVDNIDFDSVDFDNFDGGRQATQHLLYQGHKRIAFLGLHQPEYPSGFYNWSAQREVGWREALSRVGISSNAMLFLPQREPTDREQEIEIAAQACQKLVRRIDITAIVAANDLAVMGLFKALQEAGIPANQWPSVIGFDDLPETKSFVLTSLRLPWEDMGRSAADLLWERKNGRLRGPTQKRIIKMKLISRLSSRQGWSDLAPHHQLTQMIVS